MLFDFDTPIDRSRTHSVKYDLRLAKFGRADVLPLWVADMDFAAPPCVQSALARRAAHPIYGYTATPPAAAEAVARWQQRRHGWAVAPDWVLLGPGLLPLMAVAIEALSRPGEAVAVPTPVYNPLTECPERLGRRVIRLPLRQGPHGQAFDPDTWAGALTPQTRLLILCSPHNPGGQVWRREELAWLGELCLRHDLIVISDEIHADLVYPGHRHLPFAALAPALAARTITLNSPGKTFNIAGLATAYAIVPDGALRERLHAALQAHYFEGPNLFGLTALLAAYGEGEAWLAALMTYLADNLDLALATLAPLAPRVFAPARRRHTCSGSTAAAWGCPTRSSTAGSSTPAWASPPAPSSGRRAAASCGSISPCRGHGSTRRSSGWSQLWPERRHSRPPRPSNLVPH